MRYNALLPAFLASTLVSASPFSDDTNLDHLADGEVHLLKRDFTISARDIELVERDGIDLNQMYRHSVVKRDDGDHVTIWVDNSYVEARDEVDPAEAADLSKRQATRILTTGWQSRARDRECWLSRARYTGDTGPNAPTTGGPNAIINWSNGCSGAWRVATGDTRNLIVAGSNTGNNARFSARSARRVESNWVGNVGCRDVGLLTLEAKNRYQRQEPGGWRVRARGAVLCDIQGEACYKGRCYPAVGGRDVEWWLDNYSPRV